MPKFLQMLRTSLRFSHRRLFPIFIFAVFFITLVPRSTVQISDPWRAIAYYISPYQFDYIGWELGAISAKAQQAIASVFQQMNDAERSDFVRDYMADLATAQNLEAQINQAYSDPIITNADEQTQALREERDALRTSLAQRQSLAEAILEGQVAEILVEEGFGVLGQVMPPISMRFSRVPNLLVTSPRDAIQMQVSINVVPLTADKRRDIEHDIEGRFPNTSALIVPLGGIALYPAMILETSNISWAVETFAHEWLHHYLFFYPLGIYYFGGGDWLAGEARSINETSADLFGKAIARKVLSRYYPEQPLPEIPLTTPTITPPSSPEEPPAFDFASEMHTTRIWLDRLLGIGAVNAAESYLEHRQRIFYDNGYVIRRLNQAFFAFYGGYQAGGIAGVAGEDPIGPAMKTIFAHSNSIHDFVVQMRDVTNLEQLQALVPAR
jgi:hypothetical protein